MNGFTKEQLQQIIETDHVQCGEASALARIALAALTASEQEPVYQACKEAGVWVDIDAQDVDSLRFNGEQIRKVYTAPPAPVSVPDERAAFNAWNNDTDCPLAGRDAKTAAWLAWSRRAAMLQGADDSLTHEGKNHPEDKLGMVNHLGDANEKGNSPVIPDGWQLVPVELTGAMTNAMTDAILDDLHNVDVWRSVLAAAPRQEAE